MRSINAFNKNIFNNDLFLLYKTQRSGLASEQERYAIYFLDGHLLVISFGKDVSETMYIPVFVSCFITLESRK